MSIACYAFPAGTLPEFDTYLSDGNNPDEPGWFLQWLQTRGPVYAFTFDGAWFDIGTPESYLDAVSWYLGGDTFVHEDATVEDADLGANVHVMADAEVAGSELERTVVFGDATIRDSDLTGTIVDEHTRVDGMELSESLVGAYSQLE